MVAGEVAFVLIPSSLSTTIPLDKRSSVGIVPFPSGPDGKWLVGSLWFLAVPAESRHPDVAEDVAEFLISAESTAKLQNRLGRRFISEDTAESVAVVESVTTHMDSAFMDYIRSWSNSLK